MRRHIRCHHGSFWPSVEGGEPDGNGASRRTGALHVSHDTREPEQGMCQTRSLSRTSRKVRNRNVSSMAAWFRRRCADDRLTNDRQKCRNVDFTGDERCPVFSPCFDSTLATSSAHERPGSQRSNASRGHGTHTGSAAECAKNRARQRG
jgi:hypothetical protein